MATTRFIKVAGLGNLEAELRSSKQKGSFGGEEGEASKEIDPDPEPQDILVSQKEGDFNFNKKSSSPPRKALGVSCKQSLFVSRELSGGFTFVVSHLKHL